MLRNSAVDTGSGSALLSGFRAAQARADGEESQNYVGGSATICGTLGDLKCQKRLLTKPVTFSGLWENAGVETIRFSSKVM